MATIGNLNYKIGADTSGLTAGVVATKRELRDAGKIMAETRTPAERMGSQLDHLGNLYRKGAIDAETYRRKVAMIRQEKLANIPVVGRFASALTNVHPALIAAGVAAAGFTAAIAVTKRVVDELTAAVSKQMTEFDALAKQSRLVGLAAQDLRELRFAAGEAVGLNEGQVDQAMQKMVRQIAEAAQGAGRAQQAIKDLGLDAAKLQQAGPAEAIRMIADAMQATADPADRLRIAYRLFGEQGAQLAPLLAQGRQALDDSATAFRSLRGEVSDLDVAQIEMANDAMARAQMALSGLVEILTIELAPNIAAAAQMTTDFFVETRSAIVGVEDASARAGEAVGELTVWIAGAMDVAQNLQRTFDLLNATGASGGMEGIFRKAWADLFGEADVVEEAKEILDSPDWGTQFIERVMEIRNAVKGAGADAAGGMIDPDDLEGLNAGSSAIERFTERLREQVEYTDLSAEQLQLLRFEMEEVDEAQLEAAQSLVDLIELRRADAAAQQERDRVLSQGEQLTRSLRTEQERMAAELEEISNLHLSGAIDAETYGRALDKWMAPSARAEQLTKSLRTPGEKLADDLAEIQQLFDNNEIDETTYVRALENLREEADKPIVAKVDILGVESAEIGTQAAARALARFRRDAEQAAGMEIGVNVAGGRNAQADAAVDQKQVLERIAKLLETVAANTADEPVRVTEVTLP
jgi:hypothetical protein